MLLQGVCHRDLKLENTLLDGRPAPRLKICDFGYSKVRMGEGVLRDESSCRIDVLLMGNRLGPCAQQCTPGIAEQAGQQG